jgi:Pretoxin HINT domain
VAVRWVIAFSAAIGSLLAEHLTSPIGTGRREGNALPRRPLEIFYRGKRSVFRRGLLILGVISGLVLGPLLSSASASVATSSSQSTATNLPSRPHLDSSSGLRGNSGHLRSVYDQEFVLFALLGDRSVDPFRAAISELAASTGQAACRYDSRSTFTTPPQFVATKTIAKCANSFSRETEVVMADGTRKPISELKIGDEVIATDPETGLTGVRAVTAVHLNLDTELADLTVVDADGDVSVIHTTQHHPFWSVSDGKWTDVIDLKAGDRLRPTDGSQIVVVSIRAFTGAQWMWDLTIDEIHTFYVASGDESVLVHNQGGTPLPKGTVVPNPGIKISGFQGSNTMHGLNQTITREVGARNLLDTMRNPVVVYQQGSNFLYIGENAAVVVRPDGQVVTSWAKANFNEATKNALAAAAGCAT